MCGGIISYFTFSPPVLACDNFLTLSFLDLLRHLSTTKALTERNENGVDVCLFVCLISVLCFDVGGHRLDTNLNEDLASFCYLSVNPYFPPPPPPPPFLAKNVALASSTTSFFSSAISSFSCFVFLQLDTHTHTHFQLAEKEVADVYWCPLSKIEEGPESKLQQLRLDVSAIRFRSSFLKVARACGVHSLYFPGLWLREGEGGEEGRSPSILHTHTDTQEEGEKDYVLWGLSLGMVSDLMRRPYTDTQQHHQQQQ